MQNWCSLGHKNLTGLESRYSLRLPVRPTPWNRLSRVMAFQDVAVDGHTWQAFASSGTLTNNRGFLYYTCSLRAGGKGPGLPGRRPLKFHGTTLWTAGSLVPRSGVSATGQFFWRWQEPHRSPKDSYGLCRGSPEKWISQGSHLYLHLSRLTLSQ